MKTLKNLFSLLCLVSVLLVSCEKEPLAELMVEEDIWSKGLYLDTIYVDGANNLFQEYEDVPLFWKVVPNEKSPQRWKAVIQYEASLIPLVDSISKAVCLYTPTTESDFWRVSTNNGHKFRTVFEIKYPDAVETKEQAKLITEKLFYKIEPFFVPTSFITVDTTQ